jgi:glutamyl-tRNA synthetase
MSEVRLRFAPSPTGYLHVGGARTALFNWLLARKEKGKFILRIEDTDVARSTQESVDAILEGMRWLGLDWDEGPIYQSERFPLYRESVQKLLMEGKAYKCFCTPEELEAKREKAIQEKRKPKYDRTCLELHGDEPGKPYAIRFKSPQTGATVFDDLIKGRISFNNDELDDLIIQRSDGTPTYNFVVVVDDATMGITTVIRGDDHINNTPRQILLYEALGYPVPDFAHVPMILGADKARLSKRHGATSVIAYRDMGYLPEAMVNYLVRLGWSYGDQEIFSMEELTEKFSIEAVGRSAGVFNPEKLLWLNAHYIKSYDPERLAGLLAPFMAGKGIDVTTGPSLAAVVKTLQERARTLVEMADGAEFYYKADFAYDEKALEKFLNGSLSSLFAEIAEKFATVANLDHRIIDDVFKEICSGRGLKLKDVALPVRIALTGGTAAPGLFDVVEVLGKEETVRRLNRAVEFVKNLEQGKK